MKRWQPDDSPSPCRQAGRALIGCPDCGREVSARARECVHCGRPRPGGEGAGWKVVLALTVCIVIGASVFSLCAPPANVRSAGTWEEAMRHRPHGCGFLGVMMRDSLEISFIAPDSPARHSDLQVGDRVTALDGWPVADFRDFLARIWAKRPGDRVEIGYRRGNSFRTIDVVLERHPNE